MKRWLPLCVTMMIAASAIVALMLSVDVVPPLPVAAQPLESPYTGVLTADTPITTPLLTEGFEALLPPEGWMVYLGAEGGQWRVTAGSEPIHSGPQAAIHPFGFSDPADSWLVTSQITPTPSSELVFWQYERYINAYHTNAVTHTVYVTTGRQDPKYGDFRLLAEVPPMAEDRWEVVRLDLGAYAGQPIYLAFRYEGANGDTWVVDGVAVTTGLSASYSKPAIVGTATTFTATIAPGRVATFEWDLGDGTLGSGSVISHTYAAPGTYTALVTATNDSSQAVAHAAVVAWIQVFLPLVVRQ